MSPFLGQHRSLSIGTRCSQFMPISAVGSQNPPRHHHLLQRHYQKRSYQISLAKNDIEYDDINDIDDETMKRHNALSRRLFRTLLRSCRQGVEIANRGNSIDVGNSEEGKLDWILLQPRMDKRRYGHAKIVQARRGEVSLSGGTHNKAACGMSKESVGMAMEVLKFVHMNLGGDGDDDLEYYYLGSSDDSEGETAASTDDSSTGAVMGGHSEGHYTQFVDVDEERGEGNDNVTDVEWDSDEDEDNDQGIHDAEVDESVLVTSKDIQNAIKIAFRAPLVSASPSKEEVQPLSTIIGRRHRDAINASMQLSEQLNMWANKSSVSTDWEHGVRVVATSSLMMGPSSTGGKYRFAYRIRVENIFDVIADAKKWQAAGDSEHANAALDEHRAVQLLGRTWNISERGAGQASSVLQRLLEEGVITDEENAHEQGGDLRVVQSVNEPRTGAGELGLFLHIIVTMWYLSYVLCAYLGFIVGHLPVLGPGEVSSVWHNQKLHFLTRISG